MRTLEPLTSITSMTVSSPSMIFSPGLRVMMSMVSSSLERLAGTALSRLLHGGGEERGPDRGVRGLVDDLMTEPVRDEDRRAEVRTEVLQRLCRADGHVDRGVRVGGDADSLGLVVGDLHLERLEEPPRVGQRQRERRIVQRVKPDERGVVAARQKRVAIPAQADEPLGELDHCVL